MKRVTVYQIVMVLFLCMNLAVPPGLIAQEAQQEAAKEGPPPLRPEEIDQLTAPIALYPDNLLAQILAASTYPLEVVQAARFVQQNKELKGEKLLAAAKDKEWDPSVKAMLQFPDVLLMMNEKLEWTQQLGDAFLDQQADVMESVQRLRRKADESGNLKTTQEQKVIVEKETKTIVIEPANPEVVYVPQYNPTVVYGAWPYPAYPPYPVYPPGYVAGTALLSFGIGMAVGAAWGGWGCGWGNNEVNINNNINNNFNKNNYNRPQQQRGQGQGGKSNWQHNPQHRGNAQYRNQGTAQKFGQQRSGSGARASTSDARGFGGGQGQRGGGGGGPQVSDRSSGGGRESGLSGAGRGGSERASSFRGSESRGSASRSSGGSRGGGGGGGFSGGGGGGRGGGGGGGGGGRR